jgi:hypothetical protein
MTPLLVLIALAGASDGAGGAVHEIDLVCKAGRGRARVFVEMSGAVLPKLREGQWRELASESELRALSGSARPPNTEAVVRSARGATIVSMYFQDASASWAHVVDYCFRCEGRVARVSGTFNSLVAAGRGPGVRRRRTTYYDAEGGVLKTQSGVFDIDTDRALASAQLVDQDDPLYSSVRALPFSADLFPPTVATDPDPNGFAIVVRGRVSSVKACYDQALRRAPSLAGKAVARWTVDTAGKVTAFAWQSDEMKSATFSLCAERVIESWTFAPGGVPTVVSFPFVFGGPGTKESVSPSAPSSDATTFAGPAAASR